MHPYKELFLRLLSHYVIIITATQTSNFTFMASPSCCVAIYGSLFIVLYFSMEKLLMYLENRSIFGPRYS